MSVPAEKPYPHITTDPEILAGQPIVEGTRVPVAGLIKAHRLGMDFDEILLQYPTLSPADLHAAFVYYFDHTVEIDELIDAETLPPSGAILVTV